MGCSGQSCCHDGMGVGPAQVPELGRGLSCTAQHCGAYGHNAAGGWPGSSLG